MGADKTKNVFCEKAFLSLNREYEIIYPCN